ncbi:alpha/beta hydrolase-fold protein [Mucilaginibacter sp. OK098]|uniref:alpha/beta hydrolase-fold protein n=1 Tax=Mucilaginibacter sp. OK098 TaxID=1855297 RepID=UPI000934B84D|nr:alpha/beta hydrolase-fold protein [Mucilaginibacter sp. OK098]
MTTTRFILIIIINGIFVLSSRAQQADSSYVKIADVVTIHSKILNENRKIYIYTPYLNKGSENAKVACPVMYMLDAEYQLTMTAGLIDYLSKAQAMMPGMIVVGIDNNHYDRERDLTPTHSDKADPVSKPDTSATAFTRTSGGGEKFLQFINDEVMPYVEQHYKTAPFKIFSGHSLGGLLTVHCLLNHPDMFNAYFAISPSLWWDDEYLIQHAADKLKSETLKTKYLVMSISGEGGQFYQDLQNFHTLLQQDNSSGLTYKYNYYKDESHGSGPAKAIYDALKFLYPVWIDNNQDSTANLTMQFYKRLSDRYQYTIKPSEDLLINRAYDLLENPKKIDDAIEMFKLAVSEYPSSYNTYDSLGDAYVKKGDKEKAIKNYKQSLILNPGFKDSQTKLNALLKGK